MTFGQSILQLRRRLQDLRTTAGALITSADGNGMRWGANDLADKINESMDKVSRLLLMYDASPIAKQLGSNNLVAPADLSFTAGIASLDANVIAVLSIDTEDTQNDEHTYIPPERFNAFKDSSMPSIQESKYFTVMRNYSTFAKECHTTPELDGTHNGVVLLDAPEFTIATHLASELPYQFIDDFILDIAEQMCRKEDGHYEMVKVLQNEILINLGVAKSG